MKDKNTFYTFLPKEIAQMINSLGMHTEDIQ